VPPLATVAPELLAHREWLGQVGPVGLVVSPTVLVRQGVFVDRQRSVEVQAKLTALAGEEGDQPVDPVRFFTEILDWPAEILAVPPDSLTVALPEYEDHLRPTYALVLPDGAPGLQAGTQWQLLIQVVDVADLDAKPPSDQGWRATPHARLERLLRETGVPIGLLFNGTALRLVYAPNFTEWAQQRNAEAGVLIRSRSFNAQLRQQFDSLVRAKLVLRLIEV
jgi:hypothetical protein